MNTLRLASSSLLVALLSVGCSAGYKSAPASTPSSGTTMGASHAPATMADGASMAPPPAPPPPPPPAPGAMAAAAPAVGGAPVAAAATAAPPKPDDGRVAEKPAAPRSQSGVLTAGVWDDNDNFDFFQPYASRNQAADNRGALFSLSEQTSARTLASQSRRPHTELDVQLVLDTTGSMGDELRFLQTEFDSIAAQLHTRFPQVTPRWSLVLYRDKGDEYLTRPFGFTGDTTTFRQSLAAQRADGGGDFPEAVVDGISTGLKQDWRQGAQVARVMFWIADAPTHGGEEQTLASLVRQAQKQDVRIYPIAASGVDDKAEYQMRSAAQLTGGRYLFLTDDSGVGNSHAEPHIPCYSVTRLDQAIVRMLETEMSGRRVELTSAQMLRTVGQPDRAGHCKLSDGKEVASF